MYRSKWPCADHLHLLLVILGIGRRGYQFVHLNLVYKTSLLCAFQSTNNPSAISSGAGLTNYLTVLPINRSEEVRLPPDESTLRDCLGVRETYHSAALPVSLGKSNSGMCPAKAGKDTTHPLID